MNFKEAYQKMLEGNKVRRKSWLGYWFIENNKVKIYLKDGNIKFNNFTQETIANTLADDWEVIEKEVWKPQKGERYYFIKTGGVVCHEENCNIYIDIDRFNIGNCFKTEEEAQHMVEKLKVIKELKDFALENNEEKIDWDNTERKKITISYNVKGKKVWTSIIYYIRETPFDIYFTSENLARQAIETIGEERIKKYYFDVEEGK